MVLPVSAVVLNCIDPPLPPIALSRAPSTGPWDIVSGDNLPCVLAGQHHRWAPIRPAQLLQHRSFPSLPPDIVGLRALRSLPPFTELDAPTTGLVTVCFDLTSKIPTTNHRVLLLPTAPASRLPRSARPLRHTASLINGHRVPGLTTRLVQFHGDTVFIDATHPPFVLSMIEAHCGVASVAHSPSETALRSH